MESPEQPLNLSVSQFLIYKIGISIPMWQIAFSKIAIVILCFYTLFQNITSHHLESIFPPLETKQDYLDEMNVACTPSYASS